MTFSDIVPATVPLDPGGTGSVTVPPNTHLMYYFRLAPVAPVTAPTNHKHDSWRTEIFRDLLEATSADLAVDGTQIGLVKEVIRPSGEPEIGFWNLKNPLPAGTHKAILTLEFDDSSENTSPPPCVAAPDNAVIPWDGCSEVKTVTEITVKNLPAIEYEATDDPLWGRKQVYTPIVTNAGPSVTGT